MDRNEHPMRMNRFWKGIKIMVLIAIAATGFGFLIEFLWNCLMPAIFGMKTISFFQALGLLLLSKILFGGFHRHGGGGRRGWKRHMEERWEHMTPEDRQRFRAGMRNRRGCGFGRSNETTTEQGGQ